MSELDKIHIITNNFEEYRKIKIELIDDYILDIVTVADEIYKIIESGHKILIFGNGGSAADSQHIAAEFTGRFQHERRPLPAIALTTNTSSLTAIGNDYGFDQVFSRPLQALGKKGDLAWGISTSGNSENVIKGIIAAKEKGIKTFTLTGHDGGQLGKLGDYNIIVASDSTPRIQECHIFIYHCICELVEKEFLKK